MPLSATDGWSTRLSNPTWYAFHPREPWSQKRREHELADTAQQIDGGFLLAGPLVVTQDVWLVARNTSVFHSPFLVGAVIATGYGGLYSADNDRDPSREAAASGVRSGSPR